MPQPTAARKKRVMSLILELAMVFDVNIAYKKISWMDEDAENCRSAEITYREDYNDIHLKVYPFFFEGDLEEQRRALLHEFCHVISLPNKSLASKLLNDGIYVTYNQFAEECERVTSKIEHIVDLLLTGKMQPIVKVYNGYLK